METSKWFSTYVKFKLQPYDTPPQSTRPWVTPRHIHHPHNPTSILNMMGLKYHDLQPIHCEADNMYQLNLQLKLATWYKLKSAGYEFRSPNITQPPPSPPPTSIVSQSGHFPTLLHHVAVGWSVASATRCGAKPPFFGKKKHPRGGSKKTHILSTRMGPSFPHTPPESLKTNMTLETPRVQ